jgi:hypothetical protein
MFDTRDELPYLLIDNWHFFHTNIYLFILENKFQQFQIEFSKISTIEEEIYKVNFFVCVFIIITQLYGMRVQFSTILANTNTFFSFLG